MMLDPLSKALEHTGFDPFKIHLSGWLEGWIAILPHSLKLCLGLRKCAHGGQQVILGLPMLLLVWNLWQGLQCCGCASQAARST
eukprot:4286054-Amphidinium_carterae.1